MHRFKCTLLKSDLSVMIVSWNTELQYPSSLFLVTAVLKAKVCSILSVNPKADVSVSSYELPATVWKVKTLRHRFRNNLLMQIKNTTHITCQIIP